MHLNHMPLASHTPEDESINGRSLGDAQPWLACLNGAMRPRPANRLVVGVLRGEGIGPEVVGAALDVLSEVTRVRGWDVEIMEGGAIGRDAERQCGHALSDAVIRWCENVFSRGGAIINGPGGGRYVYDLRRRFDLFMKISPIQSRNGLPDASRFRPESLANVDVLITRENSGGVYQGEWFERKGPNGECFAEHRVAYSESQVRRFLDASAQLAASRRNELTVVWKESGVPSISRLWRDCADRAAATHGVRLRMVDIDLMAYRLVHDPAIFDVVAAPNLFGDVLADLGAVLLGSRGNSFSGNFTQQGEGVYQTNHGAAYDIAGRDCANPCGQILALAMMLRESFGMNREASAIELALHTVWADGWRTIDVATTGCRIMGTREMGRRVAENAADLLRRQPLNDETRSINVVPESIAT